MVGVVLVVSKDQSLPVRTPARRPNAGPQGACPARRKVEDSDLLYATLGVRIGELLAVGGKRRPLLEPVARKQSPRRATVERLLPEIAGCSEHQDTPVR